MSETSSLLNLPYIQPSQAQKHVTHNEALRLLDAVVQLSVTGLGVTTPPEEPEEGDRYVVGAGASGAWADQDDSIAVFDTGQWQFIAPRAGWVAFLRDTNGFAAFDGAVWQAVGGGEVDTLPRLGINATADTTNRLAVAADVTLLSHDGNDHRLVVNKAATADVASLLYQSDWSGRAEMGLAGEDAFSIKTSADGNAWITALRFDPATGAVSGQAVQQGSGDAASGRLMLAEHGVLRDDILGTVGQSGGVPTGAVIERGSTAQGTYVKWADGTMLAYRTVTVNINSIDMQSFALPTPIATVLGGSYCGADSLQSGGSGSGARRDAMADMPLWVDTAGWHIRLREAFAVDTLQVHLIAHGLWI